VKHGLEPEHVVAVAPAGEGLVVPSHPLVVQERGDVRHRDDDVVVGKRVYGRVRTGARAREDQRADRILTIRPFGELRENLGFVGKPEHYSPRNSGARFSVNASTPSRKSCVWRSRP
jgi:hypothetical protein